MNLIYLMISMCFLILNPPTPLWRWRRAYWGAIGYTKCSMTFVNIAVAISALAGGGPFQDFARSPNPGGVFVIFRRLLDVWASERTDGFGKILMAHDDKAQKNCPNNICAGIYIFFLQHLPNPVFFECVCMFLQWFPSSHSNLHICRHKTIPKYHVWPCFQFAYLSKPS